MPAVPDVGSYVWDLWWVAHQAAHLGNPWFTNLMAAPAGIQLGYDTTMPLAGLVMAPVTLASGPAASFFLLTVAMPGLLCYVMYRAARLWLRPAGAIAAGALFGLSSMLTWQDWYHLNIAAGTLALPLTMETAIRLRRRPGLRQGIILGVVLGASVLVNQESAVMAAVLAALIIVPWLARLAWPARLPGLARRPQVPRPPWPPRLARPTRPLYPTRPSHRPQITRPPWLPRLARPPRPLYPTRPSHRPQITRPPWLPRLARPPRSLYPTRPSHRPRIARPPWLPRLARPPRPVHPVWPARLAPLAVGALVAVAIASPQLIAMAQQASAGGAKASPHLLAAGYGMYGAQWPGLFAPSPRLADFGLSGLAAAYQYGQPAEGVPTFGLALTTLAMAGLALCWRRRGTRSLALLWLGCAALALGTKLNIDSRRYVLLAAAWHGVRVSQVLPYTWFVRIPGMSALREADRLALLGLVPAALLAGAAVDWVRGHLRPAAAAVLALTILPLAALEAGWSGLPYRETMRTALPALDGPIAADRSDSIVVDVPFGLRGGLPLYGSGISAGPLLLATADGHPRAISYTSWVPAPTAAAVTAHAFYRRLIAAQHGQRSSPAQQAAARRDARSMDVGWVLAWRRPGPAVSSYLTESGFRFSYRADGVSVYRPAWHLAGTRHGRAAVIRKLPQSRQALQSRRARPPRHLRPDRHRLRSPGRSPGPTGRTAGAR